MKTSIDFLRKATDFNVLSETTFEFNFNEHRGGSFEQVTPEKVFAYNVKWSVKLHWIDKSWGDYCYEYYSESEPILPTKIFIEQTTTSIPQNTQVTETLYFKSEVIYKQCDNYGRYNMIQLKPFESEFTDCESVRDVFQKIKQIQNREYVKNKKVFLMKKGFNEAHIKKIFSCKTANWKYEALELKIKFITLSTYPKELFQELSDCESHRQFNEICDNWAIDDFAPFSLPRKKAYCKLISVLK